jgi:predicted nucleic acid-binding protein
MIVVSDTSPVRALAHLEQLDLLRRLFQQVLVPPAVADELEHPKSKLLPIPLDAYDFLVVRAPADQKAIVRLGRELHRGEAEAIALALEVHADWLLVDESDGRAVAHREGIASMGAIGVLLRAKQDGMIPSLRPLLQRLEDELNFFVGKALREQALRTAGE